MRSERKINTDGLHRLKEFGYRQSAAIVSNWWAAIWHTKVFFQILCELPAFQNGEISHFKESKFLSFSWNIRRSNTVEPEFLFGYTRSQIATVSLGGACCCLCDTRVKDQLLWSKCFILTRIWVFHSRSR